MLQLAIPVTLRTVARVAGMFIVGALGLAVMYLTVGIVGALVLLALLLVLGRMLLNTARGR
jgi:hypothetical protein